MWHNDGGKDKKTRPGYQIHFLKYHWSYFIYSPFTALSSPSYPLILDYLIFPSFTLFPLYDAFAFKLGL